MGHQAHVNPPRYGLRTRALTISARRRRRRSNKEGLSGAQVRRRQRKSPVPSFHLGGRSIFQSATTHHPIQVPSHAELIKEILQMENVHTTSILGGLNTWITAPIDEFPDLYPIYVAYIEKLSKEETKGETQYHQLSPGDFRRLSPTRQIAEFRTLGVDAHTDQEVLKILLGPVSEPANERYILPVSSVTDLPLLDILHHERYLGKHIRRAAQRRGDAIRQASQLTRLSYNPTHCSQAFKELISTVQQISKSLDEDRRLHLLLTNRRKALLRHLRHQPKVTLNISSSTLPPLSHSNYYDPLLDEVERLPPARGDNPNVNTAQAPVVDTTECSPDPTHNWSPRRTRHQRGCQVNFFFFAKNQ